MAEEIVEMFESLIIPEEDRDKEVDTIETPIRYAAYGNRLKTLLLSSRRYIAYTSDVGESFRPVAHPYLVGFGYSISWLYLISDVSYEAWKAKLKREGRYIPGLLPWQTDKIPPLDSTTAIRNQDLSLPDWKEVAVERAIFQLIASMALPAFTIHSTVRYSAKYVFNKKNFANGVRIRTYGPVAAGLAVVPILPYMFDEPVEHLLNSFFQKIRNYRNKLE